MIKEKLISLLNVLKRSVEKFPITIISIWILTLIYTIFVGNTKVAWEVIGRITLGIVIFASSTYLIESLINEKNAVFPVPDSPVRIVILLVNVKSIINEV